MVSLYLVRHGETIENVEQILQGLMSGHLSKLGKQQAKELATKLIGIPFSQMYVSDLNRTIETALILNKELQLPMQTTPLLRERDWGTATGMKVAEVDRQNLPPSAETVEHMAERGAAFIHHLLRWRNDFGCLSRLIFTLLASFSHQMLNPRDAKNAKC